MTRPSPAEAAELAAMARLVAVEASTVVLPGYRARPAAEHKARADLVTRYDTASEALILERLAALTPEIPVVAEEGSRRGAAAEGGLVWYVDPLDGTMNFVHGHPFWCVSVGLVREGRPVAGAVVAPSLSLEWVGAEGQPSTRNGEPCRVSDVEQVEHALLATGFPTSRARAPDNNFDAFVAVKRVAQGVRRCGSAAIDLCLVADGTYDGYWERRLHAWDVAAGCAVALGAGARLTSLDGGPPRIEHGHLVVSNGRLHDELVALLVAAARP